jgi:hypothetical protein
MVEGGPIDVLTGDYLAELTMLILWKARQRNPEAGYALSFLTQLEEVLGTCLDRGIKIVTNAGGLNPRGLASEISTLANGLGLALQVACLTGDDLTETAAMDEVGFAAMIEGFQSITRALRAMAMPVIAAIEGYAVGGGLEIAAACDLRVCAEDTIFFCPEVRLGLLMSNGSSSILPRLIGAGRTRMAELDLDRGVPDIELLAEVELQLPHHML